MKSGAAVIPRPILLSALWTSMMILYAYADLLSFYRPGHLADVEGGMMGPIEATQGSLLAAAILMALPALMIVLSLATAPKTSRWLNVALGALYTLVNVSNLIGETWAYYLTLGVIEIGITLAIIQQAWTWRAAGHEA